jgi:hypothetical protein
MALILDQSQFNLYSKQFHQKWLGLLGHRLVFQQRFGTTRTNKIEVSVIFTLLVTMYFKWRVG